VGVKKGMTGIKVCHAARARLLTKSLASNLEH
jgi:hypothetical protein